MSGEFSDPQSRSGRVGGLTAVGQLNWLGARTASLRYLSFRLPIIRQGYKQIEEMRALYAFHWSLVKLPGLRRAVLIFETVFEGDWDSYLGLLVERQGIAIDWHAFGLHSYPTTQNSKIFVNFLLEHHRPASHFYVANPALTIIDHENLKLTPGKLDRVRWWGAVLPIRPGHSRHIEQALHKLDKSPFNRPHIHSGRAVVFTEQNTDWLLFSIVYLDKMDKKDGFLDPFVEKENSFQMSIFNHCVDPVYNTEDLKKVLKSRQYGTKGREMTEWSDPVWRNGPHSIANSFSTQGGACT